MTLDKYMLNVGLKVGRALVRKRKAVNVTAYDSTQYATLIRVMESKGFKLGGVRLSYFKGRRYVTFKLPLYAGS